MKVYGSATVFTVSDLDASLKYFVDVLGFQSGFRFDQYACVQRDDCCIHLSEFGNPNTSQPGTGSIYIFCDDLDNYHSEITGRGAKTDAPPKDYPYGMRDFVARDPDGNQVSFGTPIG